MNSKFENIIEIIEINKILDSLVGPIFESVSSLGFYKVRYVLIRYDAQLGYWFGFDAELKTFEEIFSQIMEDPEVNEDLKNNIIFHLSDLKKLRAGP